jgi:signal transduction histidine kinase
VVLLLVALGSWLLVRAALRPVRRLRTAAEEIQASGLHGRLPEGQGRDELAALAATLNRFLEAQHDGVERERRMVADASHELRTPLAVLTMQLDLGRNHVGDAGALEETVRAAQAQVRALSRLTTQLLELSQLESDATPRSREGGSVGALVSEAMAAVDRARTIAPPGVQVEFDIEGTVREAAQTRLSPVAFGRVVDNLTSNALRATTAGAVELRIAESAGRLVLTVQDSGSGVPSEFLAHAFDRFARSEESRAAGREGSGIGLALVRALVQDAGGRVTLANRDEGGAIATVEVPLADGTSEA